MTLAIRNLTYRLAQRALIEDISMEFKPGVLYGILGPNGSGKSTLLKTMSRIWQPTSGRIFWNEADLLQASRLELSLILSLVPQNPPHFFDFNVYQMVAMGRYARGSRSVEAQRQIEESLRQADGWHLRRQKISELSGGERQRVYIARALATEAPILLLDEPTSYLDLRHQLEIWQLLRILVEKGKLVIVAVHDLSAARRFCDELVVLQAGRSVAKGPYAEVMTPALLQEVFGVELEGQLGQYQLYSKGNENGGGPFSAFEDASPAK